MEREPHTDSGFRLAPPRLPHLDRSLSGLGPDPSYLPGIAHQLTPQAEARAWRRQATGCWDPRVFWAAGAARGSEDGRGGWR